MDTQLALFEDGSVPAAIQHKTLMAEKRLLLVRLREINAQLDVLDRNAYYEARTQPVADAADSVHGGGVGAGGESQTLSDDEICNTMLSYEFPVGEG